MLQVSFERHGHGEYSTKTTSPATIHTHGCVGGHGDIYHSVAVIVCTLGEKMRSIVIDTLKCMYNIVCNIEHALRKICKRKQKT